MAGLQLGSAVGQSLTSLIYKPGTFSWMETARLALGVLGYVQFMPKVFQKTHWLNIP